MEEKESKSFSKEEIIKLGLIGGVLIIMLIYSIFSSNNFEKKIINDTPNTNIDEMFAPINNNYTLKINKMSSGKDETIEYITDGTLKLYNVIGKNTGYILYNNKLYSVESKNTKIKEVKDKPEFINDSFANIDFIKKITKLCDLKNVKMNSLDCYISVRDYMEEYNVFFNTNYIYDGEDNIIFTFKHGSIINEITVDYSLINNIRNNKNDLIYNIRIENVNGNDYSNLFNIFSNTLKK
jgi:hypothetical protein